MKKVINQTAKILTILLALAFANPIKAADQSDDALRSELRSLGSALLSSLPKGSHLLATCGPSEGRGYYLSPRQEGWVDDPISAGRTIFVASADGKPNIFFQDARGGFVNAADDGAIITFSFIDADNLSFGMIETYPSTGVTQTYGVTPTETGERLMLWTATKVHVSKADITKVSAYVSKCV